MKSTLVFSLAFSLLALVSLGCGTEQKAGEHPVHAVSGVVTHNGSPVPGATVNFHPEAGKMPGAYARTDDQGRFTITTYAQNDGAVAGWHKITVKKMEDSAAKEISPGVLAPDGAVTKARSLIPTKYDNIKTTDLRFEVKAEKNDFSIDLK